MMINYITILQRVGIYVLIALMLGACSSTSRTVVPQVQDARPVSSTPQAMQQLNQINSLQVEIRELRNQLEEQQFELENMRQRQQDLFQGLEQRLRVAESRPQGGHGEVGETLSQLGELSVDPVTGQRQNADPLLTDQSQIKPIYNGSTANEPLIDQAAQQVASVGGVDQQALYDQGFEHLKQSRFDQAIQQFTQLVRQFPNGGLADDASYWIGEANFVNRQYESAIRAFRNVVTQYPGSDRVPESLLKVGYVQYDIGDYEAAKLSFGDVLRRYPDHPVSTSAKSRLQRIEGGLAN